MKTDLPELTDIQREYATLMAVSITDMATSIARGILNAAEGQAMTSVVMKMSQQPPEVRALEALRDARESVMDLNLSTVTVNALNNVLQRVTNELNRRPTTCSGHVSPSSGHVSESSQGIDN